MIKVSFFILIVILTLPLMVISAEENKDKEIPVGMELMSIGKAHDALVPEGTKMRKKGDLQILENANEYAARRLYYMEERIVKIEESEEGLRKEIEQLKNELIKIQETKLRSE